jgi:ceramide glucosyltransferase
MDAYLWMLYWTIAGAAIIQAFFLVLQTWEHRRFVRSCMKGWQRHQPTGRVLLCAPCKGHDINLEDNLRSLLEQDYDDYEVAFIVESADDSACPIIKRVMAAHSWMPARLIIAGRATESGQKVHNLRMATAHLAPRIKFIAFADSDARPRPEWLRMLVSRLHRPNMGAMTGYRWFVPERNSIANNLLYGLNCNLMSLLGRKSHYLLWGGSWAIRREVFEEIGLHSAWQGALSDDLVAGRLLSKAKMQVRFEPACVVASPIDYTPAEAASFVRRQYQFSRFYTKNWWTFAVTAALFSNIAWLTNFLALSYGAISRASWSWMPAAILGILYSCSVLRGVLRQDLVAIYFPHLKRTLKTARLFDVWLQPLISFVHLLIVVSACFGRHICWRGVTYRLADDGQIQKSWREEDPMLLPMPGMDHSPQWHGNIHSYRKTG